MKKSYICLAAIIFFSISMLLKAQMLERIIQKNDQHYLSNTLIIKLKEKPIDKINNELIFDSKLLKILNSAGLVSTKSLFHPISSRKKSDKNDLDKILIVKYSSDVDPQVLASKIKLHGSVEWAEPKFVYTLEYVPNDPFYSSQYALQKIKAAEAWNITTGDTAIIIAIIDTGVDWDHPDLAANIWTNRNEIPENGIDDDNNGFIDDIRGWDFGGLNGTPDNNPMEDRPDHGTHVAGDASAVTDNSIGISSIGFKSKIMPVKTIRDDFRSPSGSPYVVYGFEGIKYAADNGAAVINCSWGGGGFSFLGQEVVNYATSLGSLVVAAAGNNNSPSAFYPASYKNVLSVGATDEGDIKTSFSNYGANVDVSAPGINIYSTWQNDTYRFGVGTSFASPIAAGLATLVKVIFPSYNPNQIAEQIRTNCDDINSINPSYVNQLGRGRINALKSLVNVNSKSARAIDVKFLDDLPGGNGDGILQPGEIIQVVCGFVNYLNPTSNLGIYLESSSNYSTVQNGIFIAGAKATLDTFNNNSAIFTFQISQDVPQNFLLTFNLNYLDGSYQDFQVISAIANPTYATQTGNNTALTITSKGTLGFNDYQNNTQGDGFKYLDGENLLFEGAFMLATSANKVSDCARGDIPSIQNSDFTTVQPFVLSLPGTIANVEGACIFTDEGSGINQIGVEVSLKTFSFADQDNDDYILLRYGLKNTSSSEINNLYTGIFFDWDFANATDDYTAYDSIGNLGYVYRVGGNPNYWVASALVSSADYGFWAINNAGGDGGFSIYDGFSDSEKWLSLSSGIGKGQAGAGDISHVISCGPLTIQPNETAYTAFAIAGGFSSNDLRIAIANARTKYSQIPTLISESSPVQPSEFLLEQNYPNPFNLTTRIRYSIPSSTEYYSVLQRVTLKVYDILGNEVVTHVNEEKPAGVYEVEFDASALSSGVYYYRLQAGSFVEAKKMILVK